jgi:peroxiredoxin
MSHPKRRPAPPAPRRTRIVVLVATAAVVAAGVAVAAVAALAREPQPAAAAPATAPRIAGTVTFRPSIRPGADITQRLPADAPMKPTNPGLLAVGSPAPEFALRTPQGELVRLADYRGRTLLLEFFATWCPHCQAQAPHLVQMYQRLASPRVAFLAINVDSESAQAVLAYEGYYGLPFAAVLDPGGLQGTASQPAGPGTVSRQYKIPQYPTFYIIDPAGLIGWRADGEQPDALLERELLRVSGQ